MLFSYIFFAEVVTIVYGTCLCSRLLEIILGYVFFCVFFLDLGYVKAEAVPPPKKPLTLVPTHILVESQNFSTQPPF